MGRLQLGFAKPSPRVTPARRPRWSHAGVRHGDASFHHRSLDPPCAAPCQHQADPEALPREAGAVTGCGGRLEADSRRGAARASRPAAG